MEKDANKPNGSIQYFEQIIKPPQKGVRYNCPCCGYPTLEERGGYEICELCGWEDDGQDDPHADEVWGGPNGSLSLTAARENFKTFLDKYDPKEYPSRFKDTDLELGKHHKRALMEAFDALRSEPDLKNKAELWQKVFEYEKHLDEDLTNSVRAFEKRIAEKRAAEKKPG